jgi:hypothetical protein
MKETPIFQPRNRQDLNDWLDKITALKNAITFKLEIEKQINLQNQIIMTLEKKPLLDTFKSIIAPHSQRLKSLRVKVEISKLRTSNENNEKQKLTYHKNELLLEDDFEEIYKEMDVRYSHYVDRLMSIHEAIRFGTPKGSTLPDKDVKVLVAKYQTEPPKTKTDKLSFYLTMENLLYRCK